MYKSQESAVIVCNINDRSENSIITLPETQRVKGISVESGIYTIKKRKVRIIVGNNLDEDVRIQQGTIICQVDVYRYPIMEALENPTESDSADR